MKVKELFPKFSLEFPFIFVSNFTRICVQFPLIFLNFGSIFFISLFQKNNVTIAKIIIFQNEYLKFSRHEK